MRSRRATDTMLIAAQLMKAPLVMWMRMPVLLAEEAGGAESQRAVAEKAAAGVEGGTGGTGRAGVGGVFLLARRLGGARAGASEWRRPAALV